MAKYDIFISYSRKDAAIVNAVVSELEAAGFSIWIDKDGVKSGDAFKSVIVNAIDNSGAVLFFSSKSSNVSSYATKEIAVAIYKHKLVIPIRLDDSSYNSEIMFDLVNLDYIDLPNRGAIKPCVEHLIKNLGSKQTQLPNSNEGIIPPDDERPAHEKSNNNINKFKFLLSYKGCLISITFILIGVITLPFVFKNKNQLHECESAAPINDIEANKAIANLPNDIANASNDTIVENELRTDSIIDDQHIKEGVKSHMVQSAHVVKPQPCCAANPDKATKPQYTEHNIH